MAFTSLAEFFDKLKISDYTLYPAENLTTSQTGGGHILTAENGPRLWRGSITLAAMSHADAAEQAALVNRMMNPGMRFALVDKKRQHPASDPNSSIWNGTTPAPQPIRITAVNAAGGFTMDRGRTNYVITPGDRFHYTLNGLRFYNEFSARHTLGPLPATVPVLLKHYGPFTEANITIRRPAMIAMIVPGSVQPFRTLLTHSDGMSFDFVQVLKE